MELDDVRQAYAEEVRAVAHLGPEADALIEAFARVPREAFLGAGPWQIVTPAERSPYRTTRDADPRHLYHDVLVAIDPARRLNNGQPSALARWIAAAAPRAGDTVMHVGCGTGYYTAILAEVVGATGRVIAREVDPELAARARATLAPWPQVEVTDARVDDGSCDAVFVNAGATHPLIAWIDALAEGGRLVMPLTVHSPPHHGVGVYVCATRAGARWPVVEVSPVAIYDCAGARDPDAHAQLLAVIAAGATDRLDTLSIAPHDRGAACLIHVDGACFQAGS